MAGERTSGEAHAAGGRRFRRVRAAQHSIAVLAAWGILLVTGTAAVAATPVATTASHLIRTWQTEDGLPENSATAMVQTPDGYLWFGTFNGLVRFDGVKFTVFDTANTPELPSSAVVNLHLDRKGRLWISTLAGLVVREGLLWRPMDEAATKDGDYVRSFAERANGDLLMIFSNGRILEFAGDRCSDLPAPPGEADIGYLGVSDEEGVWWVAHRSFVGKWADNRWVPGPFDNDVLVAPGYPAALGPARDGGFWLVLNSELRKYSRGRQVAVRPVANDQQGGLGSISRITEDSGGSVWIATYDAGLTQVLPDGSLRRWNETNGISYKDVRFVFEDQEKNLWVGTSGGGLQRFTQRRIQALGYAQGDGARLVNSVAAGPDGTVWGSTFGQGLFRWDSEAGFQRSQPPSWADHNMHFTGVLSDRRDHTWVGVFDEGVVVFGAGYDHHFTAREIGGSTVTALFEDSGGRIWVSAGPGVAVFDQGQFHRYGKETGLPPGNVCALAEDRSGVLWLSNQEGVFRLNSGRFDEVRAEDGRPLRDVVCLKAGDDRTMWMGTSDRGLLRWRAGSLANVGTQARLPVRSIHGIFEDQRGFFWMTSNRGIVRAHLSALDSVADGHTSMLPCQLLDTSDGLPSVECPGRRQPVGARDSRGCLWFATAKGMALTDPARFEINGVPPPVQIESVGYVPSSGRPGKREEPVHIIAPLPERLGLPAGSSEIEVHYTALSFAAPEKVAFQVMTEGLDSGWHDRGGARLERLHALPPGHYVFRVRAANNDGVWNESGASLAFTVLPFYWQTAWFRAGTGSLLIASGGVLAWSWSRRKVRLGAERERAAEERHRSELEAQQLREELAHSSRVSAMGQLASALAHELSQPLSAILRNAEAAELVMKQEPPDLAEIQAILADIRSDDQRAAGVINRMRALLKKRNLELVDLSLRELVEDVAALTRSDALQRKIPLTLDVASGLPPVRGDRIQLQQVLLNLLLNGMDAMGDQPAESRRLAVSVRQADERTIQLAVRDAGPGIPEQNLPRLFEPFFSTKPQGLGLGLPISRTIVEAHGGQLWAENNPEGGAVFLFTLPTAPGGRTA